MSEEKERILLPKSFQVQNFLVDEVIKYLTGSEVKILLVLIRQTLGWHKFEDNISITQFMKFTGLSNRKVIDALRFLREINLVIKVNLEITRKGDTYKLNIEWSEENKKNLIGLRKHEESSPVKKVHQCKKFTTTSEESSPETPFTGEESSHTETNSLNQILNQKEDTNTDVFVHLPISKDQNNGNGKHDSPKEKKPKGDHRVKEFQDDWIAEYPPSPGNYIVTNHGKWGNQIKTLIKSLEDRYNSDGFAKLNECRKRYFNSNDKWYIEKGYNFEIFMNNINSFLNKKKTKSRFEQNLEELGVTT